MLLDEWKPDSGLLRDCLLSACTLKKGHLPIVELLISRGAPLDFNELLPLVIEKGDRKVSTHVGCNVVLCLLWLCVLRCCCVAV